MPPRIEQNNRVKPVGNKSSVKPNKQSSIETRSRSSSQASDIPESAPVVSTEDLSWIKDVMSSEDTAGFSDPNSIARLLKHTLRISLETQQMISKSSEDLTNVKHRVCSLESDVRTMDQYSRKDVCILTGLAYDPEHETDDKLVESVLKTLHFVNPTLQLTYKDFSAIHRNGKKGRDGRPPTVTVKFLRLHEKEKFMTKPAKTKLKTRSLNIFHGMCKRMVDEQALIERAPECNYVFYKVSAIL